jgi:hypothetical protein
MVEHILQAPSIVADPELADDTLHGAEEIAEYLYGDREKQHIRRVYHISRADSVNRLPTFRFGIIICARKSTILQWIKAQEARSTASTT